MSEDALQLDRILNQPITKKILELLAKENLSVSQIFKKMENIDIQKIIAYIAELQRLGLIIPSQNELKDNKTDEAKKDFDKTTEIMQIPRHEWFSPLGLPISEYNALWEEVVKRKGESYPKILDNITFTIPDTLKDQFKQDIEIQ